MIIVISRSCGLPLLDRCLQLFRCDVPPLEHYRAVNLDGGKLRQGHPLQQAKGCLLDDLDVEREFLLEFRDHGIDVVSPAAGGIVEIESNQHGGSPFLGDRSRHHGKLLNPFLIFQRKYLSKESFIHFAQIAFFKYELCRGGRTG